MTEACSAPDGELDARVFAAERLQEGFEFVHAAMVHQIVTLRSSGASLHSDAHVVQSGVADDKLVRLENFQALCRGRGLTPAVLSRDFANRVSYWSELLAGKKPFGEKIARRIEERYGLARGQLDGMAEGAIAAPPATPPQPAPAAPLKALASTIQGMQPNDRGIAIAALAAWVQQGCPAESVPRLEALLGEFLPLTHSRNLRASNGA